ncbi:6652_t:CDS:2 [Acaulospora colombiana]|uniref:6652_t:CDS:1 n=1 Tax=Acaulospora colombiana TaxID=27376 RepID=A0ACA9MXA0_9GLOM|nr:6652_t:CDS:2 [Acaulospora colombiana]
MAPLSAGFILFCITSPLASITILVMCIWKGYRERRHWPTMEEAYAAKQLAMKPRLVDVWHSKASPNNLSRWNDIKPLSLQKDQEQSNILVSTSQYAKDMILEVHVHSTIKNHKKYKRIFQCDQRLYREAKTMWGRLNAN